MRTTRRILPHFFYIKSHKKHCLECRDLVYPNLDNLDYLFDDIGGLRDVIMYHPIVGTILPFGSDLADITGIFGEFEEL